MGGPLSTSVPRRGHARSQAPPRRSPTGSLSSLCPGRQPWPLRVAWADLTRLPATAPAHGRHLCEGVRPTPAKLSSRPGTPVSRRGNGPRPECDPRPVQGAACPWCLTPPASSFSSPSFWKFRVVFPRVNPGPPLGLGVRGVRWGTHGRPGSTLRRVSVGVCDGDVTRGPACRPRAGAASARVRLCLGLCFRLGELIQAPAGARPPGVGAGDAAGSGGLPRGICVAPGPARAGVGSEARARRGPRGPTPRAQSWNPRGLWERGQCGQERLGQQCLVTLELLRPRRARPKHRAKKGKRRAGSGTRGSGTRAPGRRTLASPSPRRRRSPQARPLPGVGVGP